MKKALIVVFYVLINDYATAQHKEGFNWITGSTDCRVSFNTIDTTPSTFKVINYNTFFLDGTSCISDSTGNFLFSCDGFRIWDTLGNIMDNGDSLCPYSIMDKDFVSLYTQSSIILPFSNGIYYVITPTVSDSLYNVFWTDPTATIFPFDLLLSHKVDMKLNGGIGKVVEKSKSLLDHRLLNKTQMQACRHSNGVDWWLLKQGLDTNIVYRFLFTEDSILGPYVQNFGPYRFGIADLYGQSCFSKDGTKYAVVQGDISLFKNLGGIHDNGQLFISDFDRCTGELSNPKYYNIPNLTSYSSYIDSVNGGLGDHGGNGVSFSENGIYLYIAKFFNIMQFELNEPDSVLAWYHVAGMDTSDNQFQRYEGLFISPDTKIYIGNLSAFSYEMSFIGRPNIKGAGCNFCPKCLRFPFTGINSPPNMPDYTLGEDTSKPCWPLSISHYANVPISQLEVYPNPSSTILYIKNNHHKKKELYNSVGQRILTSKENEINVSSFSKGVYYLKCNNEVRKIIIE
jgi:hypothetical protein